jgi:hypothetical protein
MESDIVKLLTDFVFAAVFAWFLRKEQAERKADNLAASTRYDTMLNSQQERYDKAVARLVRDLEMVSYEATTSPVQIRGKTRPVPVPEGLAEQYELERESL